MGNTESTFTESQLEAYQDCTFFTKKEILRVFRRFKELDENKIPYNMKNNEGSRLKLPGRLIEMMPELKENPFRKRICQVFSDDGSGDMAFDDFLNMFSVFSESASRDIKTSYAFRIYDQDNDDYIAKADLEVSLRCLTKDGLNPDEISFVVEKVLEETDLDDDGMLSFVEFEHVISRAPDFLSTFHIRI